MPTPRPPRSQDRFARRPMAAGHVILVVVLSLVLGSLLNARSLRSTAERQPFGWQREAATTLVAPVAAVADLARLDRPRQVVDEALGRQVAQPAEQPASGLTGMEVAAAPAVRSYSVEEPLRIQVAGDSLTEQLGPAIIDLVGQTPLAVAEHEFHYSSGLTRPDFYDWPARLAELVAQRRPDVTVVMFGANDAQNIAAGDGQVLEFGSEPWKAEYARRIDAVLSTLLAGGSRVVWVGQPRMRDARFDARMQLLNSLYAAGVARVDGAAFVDTVPLFSHGDGAYAPYLPVGDQFTLMRLGDGVHLTRAGGDRMAAAVLAAIDATFGLQERTAGLGAASAAP